MSYELIPRPKLLPECDDIIGYGVLIVVLVWPDQRTPLLDLDLGSVHCSHHTFDTYESPALRVFGSGTDQSNVGGDITAEVACDAIQCLSHFSLGW